MRLNRGTIILLAISLIVIVAVLLLSGNPAEEAETPTPTLAAGGSLVPDLAAESVLSLKVTDNESEGFTEIVRADAESAWEVVLPEPETEDEDAEAVATPERDPDQGLANGAVLNLIEMEAETGFAAESLADFGLEPPAFTIEVTTDDDETIVLHVGIQNPANTRYYVQTGEDSETIYLVPIAGVEPLTRLVISPPYEPLPTATPTPTATLNPLSEVEQATATAEANATATAIMATVMADLEATDEATAEATAEPE